MPGPVRGSRGDPSSRHGATISVTAYASSALQASLASLLGRGRSRRGLVVLQGMSQKEGAAWPGLQGKWKDKT